MCCEGDLQRLVGHYACNRINQNSECFGLYQLEGKRVGSEE